MNLHSDFSLSYASRGEVPDRAEGVAGVKVTVLSGEGLVLEQGEAVQVDELWWSYAPQMPLEGKLKVGVEARDLAGNVTKEEKMVG